MMKRIILCLWVSVVYAQSILTELGWIDHPASQCLGHFVLDKVFQEDEDRVIFSSVGNSVWDGKKLVFNAPLKIQHKSNIFDVREGTWHLKEKKWEFSQQNVFSHYPMRMVASKGWYYPVQQRAYAEDVDFRFGPTTKNHLVVWGHASEASWHDEKTDLESLTLSLCSPRRPLWWLNARHAVFNHQEEAIVLKHVVARFLGIPLFYVPWLDLSFKKEPESGWYSPRIYFNSNAFFIGLPLFIKATKSLRIMLTPLISTQARMGALLHVHDKSHVRTMEWNNFFVRDDGWKYILSPSLFWNFPYAKLRLEGYRVSDLYVIENYPKFSPNVSWLIPMSVYGKIHSPHWAFRGGVDTFQDFSQAKLAAVFPYYKREPWVHLSYARSLRDFLIQTGFFYSHYSPTESFKNLYTSSDFFTSIVSLSRDVASKFGFFHGNIEHVVSRVGYDHAAVHITRGMAWWRKMFYWGKTLFKTQWGMLFSGYTPQENTPLLDALPIPLSYNQLFSLNRFTMQSRIGDYKDIDGLIEIYHGPLTLGLGMRYALQLHKVSAAEGVTLYDPLLEQHWSPPLLSFVWQKDAWKISGHVNGGKGNNFQYYDQIDYTRNRITLGLFGFKQPIDYAAYDYPFDVKNITGLGVLSHIQLAGQWALDGQWYTQLDQNALGFSLVMRYKDCCLQAGFGFKKYLISPQARVPSTIQWVAEIDFDTSSGIINTIG